MQATSAIGELSHSRRGWGFTLIEVMVALAIMTLLAVSFPIALNRMMPARRVMVTADRLASDLRWCQGQATMSGASVRLLLSEGGYSLQSPGTARAVRVASSTTLRLSSSADADLRELIIYPDGTTSGGRFDIFDSGRTAAIDMSTLTGRSRRVEQ